MRITALEEYGLRCLLNLAKTGIKGQLSISDIAEKEGLSIPYASKLLSILRKAGLVDAVRGRGGGFCISREPSNINLLEVLTALGGPLIDPNHCRKFSGQLEECIHIDHCSVHYTLHGLSRILGEFLSNTTLQNVLDGPDFEKITKIESIVSIIKSPSQKSKEIKTEDEIKRTNPVSFDI